MNVQNGGTYPYLFIKISLEFENFEEISSQNGYAYFRIQEQPPVMVPVNGPLNQNQIIEIADQAKLPPQQFLNTLDTIKRIMSKPSYRERLDASN